MSVSIIIPTWNEAALLGETLAALRRYSPHAEIICSDGGSEDETMQIARAAGCQVVTGTRGRGVQLDRGARAAQGQALWFLHADTVPDCDGCAQIERALSRPQIAGGNFRLRFSGPSRPARFLNQLYPRLAWIGLRYGDSGIFARHSAYLAAGGFSPLPIFEDLDFLRRLRHTGNLVTLEGPLTTSGRRFEGRPFIPVFVRWSWLQILFWAGCNPERLGRMYYPSTTTRRSAAASPS